MPATVVAVTAGEVRRNDDPLTGREFGILTLCDTSDELMSEGIGIGPAMASSDELDV
jgi:hypothetical protein